MSNDLDSMFDVSDVPPDASPFRDAPEPERKDTKSSSRVVNQIIESLDKGYFSLGLGVRAFFPADGLLICSKSEELAESWRTVLENDTKLRRKMQQMIKGTGWGAVIVAHAMVALPIMESHGFSLSHLIRPRTGDESETSPD